MTSIGNPPNASSPEANCTCKQCIDGWFSARMRDRLEAEAEFLQFAALDLAAELDLTPEGLLTEQYVAADTSLHYIPMSQYNHMTPAFLHGYIIILQAVLHVLLEGFEEGTACVPTVAAVTARVDEILKGDANPSSKTSSGGNNEAEEPSEELKPDVAVLKAFLDTGGKVDFAVNAVLDLAYEKSPIGGQYRWQRQVQEVEEDYAKEVGDLPKCANDLAFGLVRSKLGLSEDEMGPHWVFLSDDEDDLEDEKDALYEGTNQDNQ